MLSDQARNPVQVVIVDPESFQAVNRVEEIIPAAAEYPTGRRNRPGRGSLRDRTHIVRCGTVDGEGDARYAVREIGTVQPNPTGYIGSCDHLAPPDRLKLSLCLGPRDAKGDTPAGAAAI